MKATVTTDALRSLMEIPVVGAPLAGGSSTPELTAAVSDAGGLGFIAAGYKSVDEVRRAIEQVRVRTRRPFGVNVFFPTQVAVDEAAVADYTVSLAGEAERYGVPCGEANWSDDGWDGKLELVTRERPAVVSFTFGCPDRATVARLQAGGIAVWCTVTGPADARIAAAAGVDALVVQGSEAGGHQGSFDDTDAAPVGLLALLQLVRALSREVVHSAGSAPEARTRRIEPSTLLGHWLEAVSTPDDLTARNPQ